MSYHKTAQQGQSFSVVRQGFLGAEGTALADVLREEDLQEAFAEAGVEFGQSKRSVYTPALTLWCWLSQVLHSGAERSCEAAVDRLRSLCVAWALSVPSPDSGAYCRARAKLPREVLERLAYGVADGLEERVPAEWLWCGRHVKLVDGSTLQAPDTEANQGMWPQPSSQEPGLGFPLLRICAIFSLATGACCGFAESRYTGKETGEAALLRSLIGRLKSGDVIVGDTGFCSYWMIALLQACGVDVVFRQHQRRKTDFRSGRRLGCRDHVVRWRKPACPEWMDEETYETLPEELEIREVEVVVTIPGFRTRRMIVVTTLLDEEIYSSKALQELYRARWHAELDLRSIKVQMHLEDLRCQSPEMVRKELWVHWLAYNLIRKTMMEAALRHGVRVRDLSFSGALQAVAGVIGQASVADARLLAALVEEKLASIAYRKVGRRGNRVEPRAVKRRPKRHKLLTEPRSEARARLVGGSVG